MYLHAAAYCYCVQICALHQYWDFVISILLRKVWLAWTSYMYLLTEKLKSPSHSSKRSPYACIQVLMCKPCTTVSRLYAACQSAIQPLVGLNLFFFFHLFFFPFSISFLFTHYFAHCLAISISSCKKKKKFFFGISQFFEHVWLLY